MKNINKNKGFSLLNLVLVLALIGTVGIFGFQVGIGYINQNSIKGAVKSALLEAKSADSTSTNAVADNIEKKLSVGTIDLKKENISVTRDGSDLVVDIDYIKEVKMSERIKLVVNLSFTERTPN
jgi:type II secretory pathway pseudopilin PulG